MRSANTAVWLGNAVCGNRDQENEEKSAEDQPSLRHGEILRQRRAVNTTPANPRRPNSPTAARIPGSIAAAAARIPVSTATRQSETAPTIAVQPWADHPGKSPAMPLPGIPPTNDDAHKGHQQRRRHRHESDDTTPDAHWAKGRENCRSMEAIGRGNCFAEDQTEGLFGGGDLTAVRTRPDMPLCGFVETADLTTVFCEGFLDCLTVESHLCLP